MGEGFVQRDLVRYAQQMRQQPTPAERALWQALRRGQLNGLKFRRQAPIERYIADFYCPLARLVIEIDGITHADPDADAPRDLWLKTQGLRVPHFWNNEVLTNLQGVLEIIADAARTPPPSPPAGGGGKEAR